MEQINEAMKEFKKQLDRGTLQKAYRYIFEILSDVGNELKVSRAGTVAVSSMYHGYLDMSYLPVVTKMLKSYGLKIAVVFNYSAFRFEIWLSAVNRKRRQEIIEKITAGRWKKYTPVENDENTDAIIELTRDGITDFGNKKNVVASIKNETLSFIDDVEEFIGNT